MSQPLLAQRPQLDSLRIAVASHYLWRALEFGKLVTGADASLNLYGGPETKSFQLVGDVEYFRSAFDYRSSGTKSHAREALNIRYHLSGDSRLWGGVGALQFPNRRGQGRTSFEFAGGLAAEVPWLQERRPLLIIEGARDVQHYRTGYLKSGIRFDYEFGNRRTLFITPSQYWSGYNSSGATERAPFRPAGTDLLIEAAFDSDPAKTRNVSWRLEPFINLVWSKRNDDPNIVAGGIRFATVF